MEEISKSKLEEIFSDLFYKDKRNVKLNVYFNGESDKEVLENARNWYKDVWNPLLEKEFKKIADGK